jgi:hypothetical protein
VTDFPTEAILTLGPFIESVQPGVEAAGWELSGLQKTTSHQFEGRWDGESTRSAYLFFHLEHASTHASIDVYLDETSRGLMGNMVVVVDLVDLSELGRVEDCLGVLGGLSAASLPKGHCTPLSFRLRFPDAGQDPAGAEAQVRFKLRIPRATIHAGHAAVSGLAHQTVRAFERVLPADALRGMISADD